MPRAKTTADGDRAAETRGALAEVFATCQGEGPHVGRRHVFLRLAGCDVGCRFCDTPDALRSGGTFEVRRTLHGGSEPAREHPNPIAAADAAAIVLDVVKANAPVHAIAVTGGEPLEQPEFLADLLPRLAPHPVLLETAGVHPDALERVIGSVAIVSMDLKLPSVARTKPCWDEHARFLEIARARAREVYVKVVVNPGVDLAEFDRGAALVARIACAIPFVINPETDRTGRLTAPFSFLCALASRAAAAGLQDVRIIPQVHKYLLAP